MNNLYMTQKNELKNQLLTRKKVNLFQDKTTAAAEKTECQCEQSF